MKDYVAEFQNKIAEIDKEIQNVNIINAGIMNHGKSSLLNSILDREEFETQDVRTTTENKIVQWFNNVYLIDTPGLSADKSDDAEAFEGYRRANMILFVHTTEVGELRKNELDAINQMKKLFESEEFFWQHFCLVLTFLEAVSEDAVKIIYEKTVSDIKNHCGGENFKTFKVSNSRYKKGREKNNQGLIDMSGILELKYFLKDNVTKWLGENKKIRLQRIQLEKKDLIEQLDFEHEIIEKKRDFLNRVEEVLSMRRADNQKLEEEKSQLRQLKNTLSNLRDRHQSERW